MTEDERIKAELLADTVAVELPPAVPGRGPVPILEDDIPRSRARSFGPRSLQGLDPNKRPKPRTMLLTRPPEPGEQPGVGFLPRGIVAILAGEGGAGKTQAAVQLALSVATGAWPWLDTYNVTESNGGRVLLALGEEDDDEIERRVWSALDALNTSPGNSWAHAETVRRNLRVWSLIGSPCAFVDVDDAQATFFKAFQSELHDGAPWSLVVLDPATRFLGADGETDNKAATEWIALVQRLTALPGNPTVLVVHHTNKGARKDGATDSTAVRGSSALTDGSRWVATLTVDEKKDVGLRLVKANYVRSDLPAKTLRRDPKHPGFLRAAAPERSTPQVPNAGKQRTKTTKDGGDDDQFG